MRVCNLAAGGFEKNTVVLRPGHGFGERRLGLACRFQTVQVLIDDFQHELRHDFPPSFTGLDSFFVILRFFAIEHFEQWNRDDFCSWDCYHPRRLFGREKWEETLRKQSKYRPATHLLEKNSRGSPFVSFANQ